MELEKIIEFIKEVDKLKSVNRATLTYHENRHENSGEHSWHLALATLVFAQKSNSEIDVLKCLKMAIIHDVVEIDAGDQIVYQEDSGKFERELKAAKRIFSLLPTELSEELLELWIEFEKKETPEAIFVGSLDRFLPLYSNILNQGYSWKNFGVNAEKVYKKNGPAIQAGSEALWQKTDEYLKNSMKEGHLQE